MILGSFFARSKASDLMTLVKPRVASLVLATTAAGLMLAPSRPSVRLMVCSLLGTALLVGAANALNMYLERDIDALMSRTQDRPLPARRLSPQIALWFGLSLAVVALLLLLFEVNRLTAILGVIAFVSYVLCYTPLKQKSHVALLVGAVPGAMPPLMGWTAATASIDPPGLVLFFILFLWQIPHFLAIALFHQEEYARAGIKVFPLERGAAQTKHFLVRYLVALLAVTLYPVWMGTAGPLYFGVALGLGLSFLTWGCLGLKTQAGVRWARGFFLASIVYLTLLLLTLVLSKK